MAETMEDTRQVNTHPYTLPLTHTLTYTLSLFCISDQELLEMAENKKLKTQFEPTNENPTHMHPRLKELCTFLG